MKNRFVIVIIICLFALGLLAIYKPGLLIRPGNVIDAHAKFNDDCFACHTPYLGSTPEKCIECHKVADIGIRTSKGLSIASEKKNVAFHQKLVENDCVACHSDHRGVMPFRPISQFSHQLLDPVLQQQCKDCHNNPGDALHRRIKNNCSECHNQQKWLPASFDHEKYYRSPANKNVPCINCHEKPLDALHQKLRENCKQCHSYQRWLPATFDHDKYFRFDRDHDTECITCHRNNDYSQYTCYGCHEHSRSKIREEHVEEGIYDYENCSECHRSADEHEAERLWRSRRYQGSNQQQRTYRRESDDEHEQRSWRRESEHHEREERDHD